MEVRGQTVWFIKTRVVVPLVKKGSTTQKMCASYKVIGLFGLPGNVRFLTRWS